MRFIVPVFTLSLVSLLSGCGSSSSEETSDTYTSSYIQFYNGSANSTTTYLTLTDDDDSSAVLGSAAYTDATSLISYTADGYDLTLSRRNSEGDDVSVYESNISLKQSHKQLLLLSGDYSSPELLTLDFLRDDSLTDSFKLYVANLLAEDGAYDLYISGSDDSFDNATLVATVNYQQISEPLTFELGAYIVYLTKAGSNEVVFQSQSYNFNYLTEYVLVPRIASGPLQSNMAVDVINNTTTVTHLTDINAEAQFRVYNSIDSAVASDIYIDDSVTLMSLATDTLSSYVQLDAADYRLAALDEQGNTIVKNALLTLNQGDSKAVVFYKDADDATKSVVVSESNLPQIYDFVINVVNTITDYSKLSLYFVAPSETIDTTDYYISSVSSGAQTTITMPDGEYKIMLVYTDDNKNKTLLAQSELQAFVQGSNYLLIAETDNNSSSGYKISLQH